MKQWHGGSFINTLFLISFFTLFSANSWAQKSPYHGERPAWLTSTLTEVIAISPTDITELSGHLLIDIPLTLETLTTPTFFVSTRHPFELFKEARSGFYPQMKSFILIMPNWERLQAQGEYIKEGAEIKTLQAVDGLIYYHVIRRNGEASVESFTSQGFSHPQVKFYKKAPPAPNERVVYYKEKFDFSDHYLKITEEELDKNLLFVADFARRNQLTIEGTYLLKESPVAKADMPRDEKPKSTPLGSQTFFYTLANLPNHERLNFILEKRAFWAKTRGEALSQQPIFTPEVIFANPILTLVSFNQLETQEANQTKSEEKTLIAPQPSQEKIILESTK